MVDDATYKLMHGERDEDENMGDREVLDEEAMQAEQAPEGPFLLLLPVTIRGYGFHNKKWSTSPYDHGLSEL